MQDSRVDHPAVPEQAAASIAMRRWTSAITLLAVLLLAWLAYYPGLEGGFLFDDFANLPALGAFGPVDNLQTLVHYITSGSADPTGRPLALLSFLVDARNWPAEPYPFKRTNLLLHLCNGLLLFAVLARLGRFVTPEDAQRVRAATLGMSLWLLHPLFVSTTLYIVQREAMLPATFVLLGLLGYIAGHDRVMRGRRSGALLAAAAIAICTVLAILCKANGVLLPLLAWVVDAILLRRRDTDESARSMKWARICVLIVPTLLVFAYLAQQTYSGFAKGIIAERPWTTGERLLTEPRALVDYLRLLWMPHPYSTGLFNDGFAVSTGWFSPASTLPGILAIAALLAFAVACRRRYPAWSAALLFYFAGQLLESTSIPLELYFEHRNYVPALLMFWPLSLWLTAPRASASSNDAKPDGLFIMRRVLSIVLPLGLATLTLLRADLWGNNADQALLWGANNPHSPRAQAYAAQTEAARGQYAPGIARLERAMVERPDDIQLALNLIGLKCDARTLTSLDLERAGSALSRTPDVGRLGFEWFEKVLPAAIERRCPALDLTAIETLLSAAASNASVQRTYGRRQDIFNLQARLALLEHEPDRALELFNAALDADPRPGAALQQASALAAAGFPELALSHLDHLESVWKPPASPGTTMPVFHQWLLWHDGYWQHELAHLRGVIAADVKAKSSSDVPSAR
jgi:tetratricopeptide (TPR) repeat protein